MLHYVLQTIAFQLFFLLIYDVFLKKETFFNWNRFYLLSTAILSVVLPFIKFKSIKAIVPEQFVIQLPEIIIGKVEEKQSVIDVFIAQPQQTVESVFTWSWSMLLYVGMCIAAILFIVKLIKLLVLFYKNPKRWKGNLLIVNLLNSNAAFSFFNYVFLGEKIQSKEQKTILQHELVHVQEKHTIDLLFFEALRIAFWFNPLVYMYQSRIVELHEFIADHKALKHHDKKEYYENLLAQVFETKNISFINPFFKQALIKKRIVMLSKSKSKQIHLLKYTLLLPMVFGMLMYTSSYSQDPKSTTKTTHEDTSTQDMTDDELLQKYYDELEELDASSGNSAEIFKEYMPKTDKYILTREEYAKRAAFFKFLTDKEIEGKQKDGSLTQEDLERSEKSFPKHKTYEDYLEYKKTDEAKLSWESGTRDGILRLVVDDFKNMTAAEQQRYDQKMKMIENDDYFNTLMIVTKNTILKMQVNDIDGKKAPNSSNESDEVIVEHIEETIEVPFAVIDEVPTFTFCETLSTREEKRKCMSDNIAEHVNKNFNTNIAKEKGLTGRQRINVIFKIDKDGTVKDVAARAPHPALEEEAKRVIKTLPTFIPGKQKGKTVVVPYSLPILFQVSDNDNQNEVNSTQGQKEYIKELKEQFKDSDEMPIAIIDEVPVFKGCEDLSTNDQRKKCLVNGISTYTNKNFNTKIAKKLGLKGNQRIDVIFKIDKDGNVKDVMARSTHPALEDEAKRVINSLPAFIPGKHNGKNVVVPYSLPILFQVNE